MYMFVCGNSHSVWAESYTHFYVMHSNTIEFVKQKAYPVFGVSCTHKECIISNTALALLLIALFTSECGFSVT